MTRYTFAAAMPMSPSAAALITTAMAEPYSQSLSELGRRGGFSKFSAARAAPALLDSGLLVQDAQGYAFNREHPLASTLAKLAWRYSGVQMVEHENSRRAHPLDWPAPDMGDQYPLTTQIPASLVRAQPSTPGQRGASRRRSMIAPAEMEALPAGPDLVTARDAVMAIYSLRPSYDLWRTSQDVYAEWSNERLRDVIHAIGDLGQASAAAANTLAYASGPDAQGTEDPHAVHVPGAVWVRATYLLSAEAPQVRHRVRLLCLAVDVTTPIHNLNRQALNTLDSITFAGEDSEFASKWASEALVARQEAQRQWEAEKEARPPIKGWGGTPSYADVGTPADMLMAAQLQTALEPICDLVAQMAEQPVVSVWQRDHPDEAAKFDLVVDAASLRAHRQAWPDRLPVSGDTRRW